MNKSVAFEMNTDNYETFIKQSRNGCMKTSAKENKYTKLENS